ncbi:vWA domain-containing protein [Wenzhouxiangella sp. EGI_FJ10409]|uniref:vWA domain-containing protein n=1 Tax=Wenzhouxiangella sp. EGI_FJ10409 TaxID=3243767 RepID=UPI0035DF09B5
MSISARVFLLPAVLLFACAASASPRAVFDREPNDTPDEAETFSDQARLIGALPEGDVDLYWWSVDDAESDRLWTLALSGETDGEVTVELVWPADEEPESGGVQTFGAASSESSAESATEETALYELTITSRQSSATSPALIVPPGKHLIRVTGSDGDGDYRFDLTESGPARIRGTAGPDDTEPLDVSPTSRPMLFQLNTDTHRVTLNPEDSDRLWRVTVASELGAEIEAQLVDSDDAPIGKPVRGAPLDQNWSRSAISPDAGLRLSRADGEPIGRVAIGLEADGQRAETATAADDREADEAIASSPGAAIWIEPDVPFELDLQPGNSSWLAFEVDESMAGRSLDIDVTTEGQSGVDVCLLRRDSDDGVCREGPAEALFYDLQLDPGPYRLKFWLDRSSEPAPHTVTLRPGQAPPAGRAAEPNDEPQWAAPLDSNQPVAGHLKSQRSAWFDWKVTGEPQLWRIEAEGEAVDRLWLYRVGSRGAIGQQSRPRGSDGSDPLRLDGQWLLPGDYRVRVQGHAGDYTLAATALGQPDPDFELEPNNDAETANAMAVGETKRGRLHTRGDEDHFFFHSPGRNRLVFELDPPAGGQASLVVEWQGQRVFRATEVDQRTRFSGVVPAGEFQAVVTGSGNQDEPYAFGVDFAPPWSGQDTRLVMPATWMAEPFPADGEFVKPAGNLGTRYAFLALPVTDEPRDVVVHATARSFDIVDPGGQALELSEAGEDGGRTATLPGKKRWYLRMSGERSDQTYRIDDPALPASEKPDATAALDFDAGPVAAFSASAQRIPAQVTVTNHEDGPVELGLRAHLSHHGATVDGLDEALSLAAGATQTVDFDVVVPADFSDASPLAVFVDAGGAVASGQIGVEAGAEPIGPESPQRESERFHGLVDLAWRGLGGRFINPQNEEPIDDRHNRYKGSKIYSQYLNDGMAAAGSSIYWREDLGEPLPPLELAGDGGELHAFVFNQRSNHPTDQRWREVEIRWGQSPDDLPHAMTVELDVGDGEQFFELDAPSEARFVQLRPLNVRGSPSTTGTGLFRALGKPAAPLAEANLDVLDNDRGGHWIYSRPDGGTDVDFPWRDAPSRGLRSEKREVDVAFGFLQQRTARLDYLVWEDDPDRRGELIERVQVLTSTESPVGPWDDHGEWLLERNDAMRAHFEFPEPVRARYLRLIIDEPDGEGVIFWRVPRHIAAFEADALGSGTSALAYWGMDDQHGPWEPETEALTAVDDLDSSPDAPRSLETRVTAELAEPGDVRSYRVRLDAPDNTLSFTLDENTSGRLRARLVGADNEPIEVEFSGRDGLREANLVDLAPGDYRLDVEMPPRSIVFMWDGSGSVSAHQPAIFKALGRFAEGLEPGQEVANVMPLDGPLLIQGWAEYPSEITQTLSAFNANLRSSDSEPAMIEASRALARQDGEHVIFLITDAALVGRDLGVWDALEQVRPRIFTLEIAHGDRVDVAENRWYQNLMKSWANVANGRYRYTVNRAELIRGFEAGMREVRQPTRFALSVSSDYREPPKPGSLEVRAGDQPVLGAGVVHLIFDASGSMLQRMDGGRRIDVARQTVLDMLDEHIPDRVPIGLRAYGHTEPHSCESELLVAPDDGSHGAVANAVGALQAVNLARTPLAASLQAVPEDLAGHGEGRRLVVMLTDGEETCDGDVAAAVEALVEQGLDVRLNIVGFQIDELELQAEFEELAALGGGAYFDSQDGAELSSSLSEALAAPFRVVDAAGETVARSRVGAEAIELEPGEYELHIEAGYGDTEQTVRIAPGQAEVIRLDQAQ